MQNFFGKILFNIRYYFDKARINITQHIAQIIIGKKIMNLPQKYRQDTINEAKSYTGCNWQLMEDPELNFSNDCVCLFLRICNAASDKVLLIEKSHLYYDFFSSLKKNDIIKFEFANVNPQANNHYFFENYLIPFIVADSRSK